MSNIICIMQACKKGSNVPCGPMVEVVVKNDNPYHLVTMYEDITGLIIDGWEVYLDYVWVD